MKKIGSLKHDNENRAYIPSKEEAGYEDANEIVKQKNVLDLPKNPVVHRGQDPELFWLKKYDNDEQDDRLIVDIRSLYRHEHIVPERLINSLHRIELEKSNPDQLFIFENDAFEKVKSIDEFEKVSSYYQHTDDWSNRLIQGDSLLVMSSLLEREGMANSVQTIYIDPPYGIKYNSNWQTKIGKRDVKDGSDADLSREPEMIKAFRDTWELGIHSYLSYMRDRLLVAKNLLKDSGSCFVQISDENVHLVRSLMDEVFGSENFVSLIPFRKKTMPLGASHIEQMCDFLLFYAKDVKLLKYRQLYYRQNVQGDFHWQWYELPNGERCKMTLDELNNHSLLPKGARIFRLVSMPPPTFNSNSVFKVEFAGRNWLPPRNACWPTNPEGFKKLIKAKRIQIEGNNLRYVLFLDDYNLSKLTSNWNDTVGARKKQYVVQTSLEVIKRSILMTTDPGDLVLDPTCGSGTTAYVAEQWGRRWITIDTSRIALNIAKTRLMTAVYPYYHLYSDVEVYATQKDGKIKKRIVEKSEDKKEGDVRQGFVYEEVPHITLKSLANDEPPETETLYDRPHEDKTKLRVTGKFTVETLQNYEPISPDALAEEAGKSETIQNFERNVLSSLEKVGIKTGDKKEHVMFKNVRLIEGSTYLNAEGTYNENQKAYFHIGPKFGTVSRNSLKEAIIEFRSRNNSKWLVILGFSFEHDLLTNTQSNDFNIFVVTRARISDDFLQEGLLKNDKKSGSFITIGEPDLALDKDGDTVTVRIQGLDIYDPIQGQVKSRNVSDIVYWMVDDNYDGNNFTVKQVFFCGGERKEFEKWQKGLENLAKINTKRKAEQTLKIVIEEEAFDRLYGYQSHPIPNVPKRKIAVRVISQYGEESMKVLTL